MKIYIKNMVCLRCIMLVRELLESEGHQVEDVQLGYAAVKGELNARQLRQLDEALRQLDLSLICDKKEVLTERVKNLVIEMIHHSGELPKINYSTYLSEQLSLNYTYISNTFSELTGTTIENYIISNKIERVKELLMYDELSLTQIADIMHYSSVAHLSNQFKKITGYTPSWYKKQKKKRRLALEEL